MEVFDDVKIKKPEAFRIAAVEFAIRLHNFRTDVTRDTAKFMEDVELIREYLENGT